MELKKLWKKVIAGITFVVIIASTIFGYVFFDFDRNMQNPKTWNAYSPSDQRFHIQFPKDPESDSKEMDVANTKIEYNELKTKINDTTYAVNYLDFPGKWKLLGVNKLLGKTFDMLMSKEKGEVLEKKLASHKGNASLDYRYIVDGKEIQGKLVVVGNTLYRLTVEYPKALAGKVQSQAFLNSFEPVISS